MKVLHVIPSLSAIHGGPTHALAMMERASTQQGIEVETATTDDDGPGQRNGKRCGVPLRENGVVRRYFPKRTEFYKVSPALAAWITREVRGYDIVHIHALFSFTSSAAAWAARRAGVPYVIRPLGTLNSYGMEQRRSRLKSLSMRLIEETALRHAAAVHFTSEQEAAEARRLGLGLREAVIPLGVEDVAPSAPVTGDGRFAGLRGSPCVLFLSRLDAKKNLEGLLDALAIVRKDAPGIRLVVGGDGPPDYVAALRSRAEALGLASSVIWAGYLEGAGKAAALAAADVFALPSFSENFGIAAAEALAAGVPCLLGGGVAIAADVALAKAGVVTGTDPQSISAGLRSMVGDPAGLAAMSAKATELARERFSVEAMGVGLKNLYTKILGQGAAPGGLA